MYVVADDMKELAPLPPVGMGSEAKNSQRAKDLEVIRLRDLDLKLIIEGNHPLEVLVPDPHTMTKQQWDEFGRSVYDDDDAERKFFVSESRLACMIKMRENKGDLESFENIE